MPSRVLRESILTSERGAEVIRAVERAHWRIVKSTLERESPKCRGDERPARNVTQGEQVWYGDD